MHIKCKMVNIKRKSTLYIVKNVQIAKLDPLQINVAPCIYLHIFSLHTDCVLLYFSSVSPSTDQIFMTTP